MAFSLPSSLYCVVPLICALALDFSVAVATVHRPAVSWLERYLCLFATRGADGRIHFPLPWRAVATPSTITTTLLLPGRSALRTTLRLIGEALVGKELLLGSGEGETQATLRALEGLVHIAHG